MLPMLNNYEVKILIIGRIIKKGGFLQKIYSIKEEGSNYG